MSVIRPLSLWVSVITAKTYILSLRKQSLQWLQRRIYMFMLWKGKVCPEKWELYGWMVWEEHSVAKECLIELSLHANSRSIRSFSIWLYFKCFLLSPTRDEVSRQPNDKGRYGPYSEKHFHWVQKVSTRMLLKVPVHEGWCVFPSAHSQHLHEARDYQGKNRN